jgi:hypothetical protein
MSFDFYLSKLAYVVERGGGERSEYLVAVINKNSSNYLEPFPISCSFANLKI